MKLSARDGAAFLKAPRDGVALVLLFGPDAMRTSLKRTDFLNLVLGPEAEADMRLTRMTGAELRSEAAALQDAMKAIGFFPGKRGVLITDAGDGIAPIVSDALQAATPEDALVVIEAGNLGKGSKLRKLAEGAPNAVSIGIYVDPPSRASVEDALAAAGLSHATRDAKAALLDIAMAVDPGDFRQILEKASLYSLGNTLTADGVAAIAPSSTEAGVDTIIAALADGRVAAIGPGLQRLAAQGVTPVTLCITAMRHFRQLHVAASDPGGPDSGMGRLRPPVFGPRRDQMARQVRSWGAARLERAITVLYETDLSLRSASLAPQMALTERAFIRIAMINPAGR